MKPFINIGPGEFIKEELEIRNWTQQDLANVLNASLKFVNELIKNKQSITLDTARLLSNAFGQSPQYWLNLDTNYRLRLTDKQSKKEQETKLKAAIYNYMPVREMMKKRWINPVESIGELESCVKGFWRRDNSDLSFLDTANQAVHYRKSAKFPLYNSYYSQVWLQMAINAAKDIAVPKYNAELLAKLSENIGEYTVKPDGATQFLLQLNNAGIKFIVLSHLEKTYIDGASFYDGDNPVIVYTCRHNRVDNFWFTICHEIAHILLHFDDKTTQYIDSDGDTKDERELQADKFASDKLQTSKILGFFKTPYITKPKIEQCSRELKLNQAIIVGVLQHHGRLSQRNLNGFKTKVDELIPEKYWVEKRLGAA